MRSIYIHIPFCKSICSYCDFCKMIYNSNWANTYLDELKKEINTYYEDDEIKSIYIGGGTPSSLNNEELKKLFEIIETFKLIKNCEITFEMNVNDINDEICRILKDNMVNRISVGIESFDQMNLKFLNRKHTMKEINNKINLLKLYNFNNINVDLIYALPIETFTTFKKDLNKILKLNVNHISTYSLIIEENTVLYNNKVKNIEEELDYKMYQYICKTLRKKGYIHYEVSNFAKEGYESIHNLTYWYNDEYYGFGLGASGYINGVRYDNTRSLNKYINSSYRVNEYFVSKKEEMENEVMLGLRCLKGIDIYNFYKRFNENIQDVFNIKEPVKKGLLVLKDKYLMIPEEKIYIMNEIINNIINTK